MGAASGVSFTLTVLPFALYVHSKVRSMALGGVVAAGAMGLAALHHALEHRPFAEVLPLLELPL
jgi:hypothetical protein